MEIRGDGRRIYRDEAAMSATQQRRADLRRACCQALRTVLTHNPEHREAVYRTMAKLIRDIHAKEFGAPATVSMFGKLAHQGVADDRSGLKAKASAVFEEMPERANDEGWVG